ncbi:hypothetical protein ACFQWA_23560 [Streptomyces thermogriseus]
MATTVVLQRDAGPSGGVMCGEHLITREAKKERNGTCTVRAAHLRTTTGGTDDVAEVDVSATNEPLLRGGMRIILRTR